jgi:hypothetical protein
MQLEARAQTVEWEEAVGVVEVMGVNGVKGVRGVGGVPGVVEVVAAVAGVEDRALLMEELEEAQGIGGQQRQRTEAPSHAGFLMRF